MSQPADCIHILVFILWPKPHSICHTLPSFSKHCLSADFAEPQNSLPKSGHEHYHDSLNIAYIISHVNNEFLDCFMGGLPALDTFPRITCPQIIPHKLALLRLHICARHAQTIPAPIALKIYQDARFSASFLNMQAEIVFSCSGKHGDCFKFCCCTFVKLPIFTFHASQCHSSVHGLLSHTNDMLARMHMSGSVRLRCAETLQLCPPPSPSNKVGRAL
jgi:hypothetical protein